MLKSLVEREVFIEQPMLDHILWCLLALLTLLGDDRLAEIVYFINKLFFNKSAPRHPFFPYTYQKHMSRRRRQGVSQLCGHLHLSTFSAFRTMGNTLCGSVVVVAIQ